MAFLTSYLSRKSFENKAVRYELNCWQKHYASEMLLLLTKIVRFLLNPWMLVGLSITFPLINLIISEEKILVILTF